MKYKLSVNLGSFGYILKYRFNTNSIFLFKRLYLIQHDFYYNSCKVKSAFNHILLFVTHYCTIIYNMIIDVIRIYDYA